MGGDLSKMRILNVSQAARYSGYSRGWIESWLRDGLLPYESPPSQGEGRQRRKYIRRADFDAFLERYYQRSTTGSKRGSRISNTGVVTLLQRGSV